MRISFRNITKAGHNVAFNIHINEINVTPAGVHTNQEEFTQLRHILEAGVDMIRAPENDEIKLHTFEVEED